MFKNKMAWEDRIELIVGTIAVLFEPPEPRPTFSPEELTTFMRRPLSIGQTAEGLTIVNSSRDQIDAHLGNNKLDIRGTSGELSAIKEKVPRVLIPFLELLGLGEIQSYGVNLVLEVSPSDPNAWISSTFLSSTFAKQLGTPVASSGIVLKYSQEHKEIILRLDARSESVLSVNFNASQSGPSLPSQEELGQDLDLQYTKLLTLLQELGV